MRLYRRDWRPRQAQAETRLMLLRPAQPGPISSLESRSARQSSRSLAKVFVLGAWVVPEPVRRHQSRTIPPQLRELHTGLPDIPCKLQALPPHFERMSSQPKPLGPSCQLWMIGNRLDKLPFERWVHRPPRPENGRPGIGREWARDACRKRRHANLGSKCCRPIILEPVPVPC